MMQYITLNDAMDIAFKARTVKLNGLSLDTMINTYMRERDIKVREIPNDGFQIRTWRVGVGTRYVCSECGHSNLDVEKFCSNCGAKFTTTMQKRYHAFLADGSEFVTLSEDKYNDFMGKYDCISGKEDYVETES